MTVARTPNLLRRETAYGMWVLERPLRPKQYHFGPEGKQYRTTTVAVAGTRRVWKLLRGVLERCDLGCGGRARERPTTRTPVSPRDADRGVPRWLRRELVLGS